MKIEIKEKEVDKFTLKDFMISSLIIFVMIGVILLSIWIELKIELWIKNIF